MRTSGRRHEGRALPKLGSGRSQLSHKMVVFPALSSPSTRIRASLSPNMEIMRDIHIPMLLCSVALVTGNGCLDHCTTRSLRHIDPRSTGKNYPSGQAPANRNDGFRVYSRRCSSCCAFPHVMSTARFESYRTSAHCMCGCIRG